MKKLLSIILCLSIAASLLVGATAASADEITVELDGTQINFDVNPQIIDGRTMVPLRKIFEEIGALVKWDNDTQTVTARKSSKTITLSIGSAELTIDKGDTDDAGNPILETVTLDVPAQIVSGRTLVPARAISESFGLNVDWEDNNQKVLITSDDDEDDSWKENTGTINLSDLTYEGEGIEITDNQIKITAGGDFTLTGTLADGNITISTKEKVKLRLSGANITSSSNPCIFVEDADKAYITITEDTENSLVAANSEDGAIYSKDNLEIKGNGTLSITSSAGHGIKASDNLSIENGNINIDATSDGIHINDTFKMTDGNVNITAIGDGIDSESIVIISGGAINIETNGVPLETPGLEIFEKEITSDSETETSADAKTDNPVRKTMRQELPEVEFEKSSKGINAEWMMVISDGEINVNSASHSIHCEDEIEINGGVFELSSKYEKGISAHGNLTVNGADTEIDVVKSTEGLESKNVMTVNDGKIKVVSLDDALNATGGNSAPEFAGKQNKETTENGDAPVRNENFTPKRPNNIAQNTDIAANGTQTNEGENRPNQWQRPTTGNTTPPEGFTRNPNYTPSGQKVPQDGTTKAPGGNMGGMKKNMKNCLVINGGELELYAEDDCLDANGNLVINGGIIKATKSNGAFSGPEGIIDPDGQTVISDTAVLMLASGKGNERNLQLKQNTITVYCESTHSGNEKIEVLDKAGSIVYEYTPVGSYSSVLISSSQLDIGDTYKIGVGDEIYEVTLSEQNTIIGTAPITSKGNGKKTVVQ